ncbi:MAG TPA: 2-C-methyl-D-erythritol 2,4-cyclodiphosphate synthase [Bacteroidales bacterium]|nr:2-C-methyl-D-erythritol 2,4-cyclodiphosphate synthase [Bacteroidales bacterium]
MSRIGFGFDTHKLETSAELFLGGVKIPSEKGSVGHSDGDVLIHAICDALLGAANLGDIGTHFPDTDPQYKGIDSTKLLAKVIALLNEKNYHIANIDTTVCLEKPKIAPVIGQIQKKLSEVMGIPEYDISVKAKTSEKLGFIGRQEGISAYAIVLLD